MRTPRILGKCPKQVPLDLGDALIEEKRQHDRAIDILVYGAVIAIIILLIFG